MQINKIFSKIIATKVSRNLTTRMPANVIIGIFDENGQLQISFALPGELFPPYILAGDELVFIPKHKLTEVSESSNVTM